jgi:hypothetical protein
MKNDLTVIDFYGLTDRCSECGARAYISFNGDGIVKCSECSNMTQSEDGHHSMGVIEWNKAQRKVGK